MMTKCVSPWYNCTGCLGIKQQFTYLLVLLACSVKGYCAMLIGQASSCRFLHDTVFSMLIGQASSGSYLHDTVFSMLIGQASSCRYLHDTVFSMLIGQASSCSYLHDSFLFKEGTVIMGGWKACYDINQGDKGTDIPSQLWCLFTSPKSWLAQVFLPRCIGVLCRGGNSQYALTPFVRHDTDWHTCSGEHRGRWCLGWSWFSPCGPERPCGPARELTMMVCV